MLNGAREVEREADQFAAGLLMPLDDFRRQIRPRGRPSIAELSASADRYEVSFIAAILRWLSYTEQRALLAVSRDGFILWTKPSERALRSGAYIRTSGEPVELPAGSLAAQTCNQTDFRKGEEIAAGVWLPEKVQELVVVSDQYDLRLSLLLLQDDEPTRFRDRHAIVYGDGEDDPVARPIDEVLRR